MAFHIPTMYMGGVVHVVSAGHGAQSLGYGGAAVDFFFFFSWY